MDKQGRDVSSEAANDFMAMTEEQRRIALDFITLCSVKALAAKGRVRASGLCFKEQE